MNKNSYIICRGEAKPYQWYAVCNDTGVILMGDPDLDNLHKRMEKSGYFYLLTKG
jgi:hypothetical protein